MGSSGRRRAFDRVPAPAARAAARYGRGARTRAEAPMSDEFLDQDATAQAQLVRRRELSPEELVRAAICRSEERNPALGAFVHLAHERALERAKDPALPDGPFRGVPFAMKDLGGPEAGEPHHAGMAFLKRHAYRE